MSDWQELVLAKDNGFDPANVGGISSKNPGKQTALDVQVGGSHYKDMVIQPIEFCQKNRIGYAESLAIKYLCRHRQKNGEQDLRKAIHCIELLIDLEYKLPPPTERG